MFRTAARLPVTRTAVREDSKDIKDACAGASDADVVWGTESLLAQMKPGFFTVAFLTHSHLSC